VIEIPSSALTLGPFNIAILVKKAGMYVKSGIEQRDLAVMSGAYGATTLIFTEHKLKMPRVAEDIFGKTPVLHTKLVSEFHPEEDDVIIIGSAETKMLAEIAAKRAAFQLIVDHP
jgi:hypothetical protein